MEATQLTSGAQSSCDVDFVVFLLIDQFVISQWKLPVFWQALYYIYDILHSPQQWLTSRKPLWCDMTPTDIKSQWRESWKSSPVVNAHLIDDPTIQQPGFTLARQQWSFLNRFRTGQRHCGACRKTWCLTDTDLCSCGETQTMSHILESCPLTKLNGGLYQLHSADDAATAWLTNYGS